ncbi:hypothetical protein IsfPm1_gp3 [Proteus phage Isf-Pm1]|nr:hypothetical protein IsfPm1_gp3 [Proteus phage Isf-Pm1]
MLCQKESNIVKTITYLGTLIGTSAGTAISCDTPPTMVIPKTAYNYLISI